MLIERLKWTVSRKDVPAGRQANPIPIEPSPGSWRDPQSAMTALPVRQPHPYHHFGNPLNFHTCRRPWEWSEKEFRLSWKPEGLPVGGWRISDRRQMVDLKRNTWIWEEEKETVCPKLEEEKTSSNPWLKRFNFQCGYVEKSVRPKISPIFSFLCQALFHCC